MDLKNIAATAAAACVLSFGAVGLTLGAGAASADPGGHGGGPPCWAPYCHGDDHGNGGDRGRGDDRDGPDYDHLRWDQRGIDQGRYDHQPFNFQGQRVEPYFDNYRGLWGFWFLGAFIAL
jgi:hypothetical protein